MKVPAPSSQDPSSQEQKEHYNYSTRIQEHEENISNYSSSSSQSPDIPTSPLSNFISVGETFDYLHGPAKATNVVVFESITVMVLLLVVVELTRMVGARVVALFNS